MEKTYYKISDGAFDVSGSPLLLNSHYVPMCPLQWQHEDILGSNNQPLCVSIPPRSVILSNMKKKLYKLSQDEGAIVAIQVSITTHIHTVFI